MLLRKCNHGKASNLAINAELGTFPACFKSFILMFKYYNIPKRIEFDFLFLQGKICVLLKGEIPNSFII
jgi:hypothetical protein